jgi:hypothetical protein
MLTGDEQTDHATDSGRESFNHSYDYLKELDPVAANRLHPNDHRKVGIPTFHVSAVLEKHVEMCNFCSYLISVDLIVVSQWKFFHYSAHFIFFLPRGIVLLKHNYREN